MTLTDLVRERKDKIAIIGMGYVGLPHAYLLAKNKLDVLGVDIDKRRVDALNAGNSYVDDIDNVKLKEILDSKRFQATTDYSKLADCDVVMICVPTPLNKNKLPDVSYISSAGQEIKKYLHKGQLIILESTSYPMTTEEILLPLFQETGLLVGKDYFLAFAPERIDPGNKMPFEEVPKVVGGITPECTKIAVAFYEQFLKHVHAVSDAKTAEMTKILENTYRLVNISMINEFRLLCGKMGIDIWEVIEAAKTKPYGFTPFYPSPKVGGHCIAIDPFYLSWKAREYNFWARFIELAGELNEQMPHYVMTNTISFLNKNNKHLNGLKVLILGVAYKKDIGDPRESAAYDIIPNLQRKGAIVDYYDPYIPEFIYFDMYQKVCKTLKRIEYSPEVLKNYDLVMILTDHSNMNYDEIAQNAKLIVDTRNAIKDRKYNNISWF
ncbi:MAG TPA: nucleotide sugar dehydrogenase [Candidatus Pacearchaeota archaeon]|nr:nucleotide sugar dehydrogenase [Candidatus Pacearchaeota archaeon]HQI74550.1 nucleotide sugar dehydrogenase [Candidatus Pacearchaeota archaeon]